MELSTPDALVVIVAFYSKDEKPAATEISAAMIGLPTETETALDFALCCGIDVAETVTAADPIVALGIGLFAPFSAIAAAESLANPIESG